MQKRALDVYKRQSKGNKYNVTVPGQNQPQKINRPREKGAYADELISPVRSRRNVWPVSYTHLHGLTYQKLGKELMTQDEIAVMDGGKCILQLRGVRPFLSDKYEDVYKRQPTTALT